MNWIARTNGSAMPHVVLLGDSILDNGRYVAGGSPIVEQLRARLPDSWQVTLLARDGAIIRGVFAQLEQLPGNATHLVVSAGGNDALEHSPLVNVPAAEGVTLLSELVAAQQDFERDYGELVRRLVERGLPTIGCTIYDAVPGLKSEERMALSLFNDVIVRQLVAARNAVLDLRGVCVEPRDYAAISPIEPSEIGGNKIAMALQRALRSDGSSAAAAAIYS